MTSERAQPDEEQGRTALNLVLPRPVKSDEIADIPGTSMVDRREALAVVTAAVLGTGTSQAETSDQDSRNLSQPSPVGRPRENAIDACLSCRDACRKVLQEAGRLTNTELARCCHETFDLCRQVIRRLRREQGSSAAICQACADACARLGLSADGSRRMPDLAPFIEDVERCRLACEEVVLAGR